MGSADAADFDRFVSSVAAPTIMSRSPPIDQPVPQSRVKRISSVVEKTVDKLSRSVASSPTIPAPSSPRSVFGLSRKSRTPHTSQDMTARMVASEMQPSARAGPDDSPFIRPPSPPVRPGLSAFRGDQSIRAGTQTLIQALQALPWMKNDNDDDGGTELSSQESDGDDDDQPSLDHLSSSIHTIHRPIANARSHRPTISLPSKLSSSSTNLDDGHLGDSSEDDNENDFEDAQRPKLLQSSSSRQSTGRPSRPHLLTDHQRTGSMATIRQHRRTRLAEKLQEVFDLPDIREVLAEMPCWLLRSVLLQGYMYLTNSHLCFFAHMPSREDQVLKSGSLNKKAQRTKRWIKHWFILKNDALSWYQSSSDPYFPHGIVDLRYAISCEPVGEKGFRLRTNTKAISLSADSVPSREEWVKAIRKVIFKAQNMGDSVKIAIPYSVILDVEQSSAMDFSETIEVKTAERDDQATDSYFFAYFHDISVALEQIRDAVRSFRSQIGSPETTAPLPLLDTTAPRATAGFSPADPFTPKPSPGFRLSTLFWPLSDISLSRSPLSTTTPELQSEEYTHVSKKSESSFVPLSTSPLPVSSELSESVTSPVPPHSRSLPPEHTYPPSVFAAATRPNHSLSREPSSSTWVGVPSWLKNSRKVFGGSAATTATEASISSAPVKEIYSGPPSPNSVGRLGGGGDLAFSILETPNMGPDQENAEKFRATFAYDEKEQLLGYFPGYIFRLLPVFGKLYVSTNYFCFKSTGPLAQRTRMTLPIRDILACERSKATRFGHHGLIVIIRGHEELFFEFNAEDKRDAFVQLLEAQLDDVRKRLAQGDQHAVTSSGKREALILEEFETKTSNSDESAPSPAGDTMADSMPAVMFTSASSTFLTFKPKRSLRFTFLTIGSRGDVQPYIALSKGLIADGHKCKIATHGEFKDWIESHGIEYGYIGGDPAELLNLCVENGTFTVSFLKEGLLKFRGWLDDLLKTSWEACQDSDVLVESPSAMGGFHIAEALRIPYYRAFTMTWSRTRAYPHAFAVPEKKMGGGYNYMSYVMFDQVFWRATSGQINRWRRDVLHLPPTSLDKMEPHKIPFLYNFSPSVVPPPLDWPEWIRVTGYWFLDDADVSAKKWAPPPSLLEFIDKSRAEGRKIVYIGFGSIVVSDPKSMTRAVVEAVKSSGVAAILSKGWSDRLQVKGETEVEEPLPPQIYPVASVPHDWLFARIDAACHHGGAGSTGASLRAGIPTIIKPFFGDQFFWADRVEALGVGSGVRKLTASHLAEALVTATTEIKQIEKAKLLGEHIRSENGVANAIECIYRDLDYAKSLIKQPYVDESEIPDMTPEDEDSTIRRQRSGSPLSGSRSSSGHSVQGAPSEEEWSVISNPDDRRSSTGSRLADSKTAGKRTSFAAAVMSVLPDSFTPGSPTRRNT